MLTNNFDPQAKVKLGSPVKGKKSTWISFCLFCAENRSRKSKGILEQNTEVKNT